MQLICTGVCFTTLGKLHKWVFMISHCWRCKQHTLFWCVVCGRNKMKALVQRHLISHTNYTIDLPLWIHYWWIYHFKKTHLWSLSSVVKHPQTHIDEPDLQICCIDLTTWQGTRVVAPAMDARWHTYIRLLLYSSTMWLLCGKTSLSSSHLLLQQLLLYL